MSWLIIILLFVLVLSIIMSCSPSAKAATGGKKNKPGYMYLGEVWFNEIEAGNKKIHIIPSKPSEYTSLEGTTLTFYHKNKETKVECTKVKHYDTVEDLIKSEDLMKIAPHLGSKKEVENNIKEYYTPDRIEKAGGISAIHFK